MMLCFIGSFGFYFFTAIADNVWELFLSHLTGFLLHGFEGEWSELN